MGCTPCSAISWPIVFAEKKLSSPCGISCTSIVSIFRVFGSTLTLTGLCIALCTSSAFSCSKPHTNGLPTAGLMRHFPPASSSVPSTVVLTLGVRGWIRAAILGRNAGAYSAATRLFPLCRGTIHSILVTPLSNTSPNLFKVSRTPASGTTEPFLFPETILRASPTAETASKPLVRVWSSGSCPDARAKLSDVLPFLRPKSSSVQSRETLAVAGPRLSVLLPSNASACRLTTVWASPQTFNRRGIGILPGLNWPWSLIWRSGFSLGIGVAVYTTAAPESKGANSAA